MRNLLRLVVGSAFLLLPFALAGGALAAPAAATPPLIAIVANDFSFDAPSEVPAGPVAFVLKNEGKEPHHAQFARLNDGKTLADLEAALKNPNPTEAFAIVDFEGGVAETAPGTTSGQVVLDLKPGEYVLICFISSADGTPHFAKGMIKAMTVKAGGEPATAPAAAVTVNMRDYAFDVTGSIAPGQQVWKVVNAGKEPHEMQVFRVLPGKTQKDVEDFLKLPEADMAKMAPPAEPFAGIQAMGPGGTGWFSGDFTPATYVALCFVPNSAGTPHVALGMVKFITVGDAAAGSAPQVLPTTGDNAQPALWLALLGGAGLIVAGAAARRRATVPGK